MLKFKWNLMFQNAISCDAKDQSTPVNSTAILFLVKKVSFFATCLIIINLYSYQTQPALSIRPGLTRAGVCYHHSRWQHPGHCDMVLTTWPACSPAQLRRSRSDAPWGRPCRASERTRRCPVSTTGHVCSCYTSKSATCKTEGVWGRMLKLCTFNWAAPCCLLTLMNTPLSVMFYLSKK